MARTNTNSGSGSGGIQSINNDTTSAQLITAGNGINVSTSAGDTRITFLGVTTDGVTVLGDGVNTPLSATFNQSGKYLLSGGIAWSGTGYTYDVSVLKFVLDGVTYGPIAPTPNQVTMSAADPTFDRFDAVVVDALGNVSVITGTPSDDPADPTIPDDKVCIGYVFVGAGTTQPTILTDNIYLDPTQWATSTYTTGIGATGSANFASTNAPKQGTKCIGIVSNARFGVRFTRASAIDVQQFTYLQIWYRNDTTLLNTKVPYVRFDNSLGNPVGNTVNLLNYGISRGLVGTWQLAQIPISAFGNISLVKGLRAIITGGTLAQQASWSLDYILVSGGLLPQGALGPIYLSPSNTLYSTGAASGATGVQNSQFFGNLAGYLATAADFSIFEGYASGYSATSAYNSIMLGDKSGFKAANANNVQFIGSKAGYGAINADNSQFIGTRAGYAASSAYSSTFFGTSAGDGATNAYQSSFIGRETGRNAVNASDSAFFGYQAGDGATNASNAFFMGVQAGQGAVDATGAIFMGAQAGQNSASLGASIFIGQQSGQNSTSTAPNILIGAVTSDGGFDNVIALGTTATATRNNQFIVGSGSLPITDIHWQGILTSSDMHNNALPQGNSSVQQVRSGTYTPTLTNVANITTSSASPTKWFRIGNIVHVEGQVSITPTSNNTATIIDISLPVPSTLGNSYVVSGVTHSVNANVAGHGGSIVGQTSNNTARLQYYETSGAADIMTYEFSYEVL